MLISRIVIIAVVSFLAFVGCKTYETSSNASIEKKESLRQFMGMGWGIGPSLTSDLGENDRVESASVDNRGIVRVENENNDIPRILLETHHFFVPDSSFLGLKDAGTWGWGPFVGVQTGSDETIDAFGAGFLLGFRNSDTASNSFNVGLGVIVDPDVQILGDGIEKNKKLRSGDTLRFKEKSQWGVLLLFSFNF